MLPVRIAPIENELVSSWLKRLANNNGTDLETLSHVIFNNSKLLTKDIDKSLTDNEINNIASFINIDKNIIYQMTVHAFLSKVHVKKLIHNSKWTWFISSGIRYKSRTYGLQFCPECLKENSNIFYIFNKLSWNVACPKHKVLLHTNCPRCNSSYNPSHKEFNRSIKLCDNCDFDLSLIETINVDESVLYLQDFLNNLIIDNELSKQDYIFEQESITEIFYTIRVFTAFLFRIKNKPHLVNKLSMQLQLVNHNNRDEFDKLSSINRAKILSNVATLLSLNIESIKTLLSQSKITYSQFLGSNKQIPQSSIVRQISNTLKLKECNQNTNPCKKHITPRSIEEVDLLMNELEQYL